VGLGGAVDEGEEGAVAAEIHEIKIPDFGTFGTGYVKRRVLPCLAGRDRNVLLTVVLVINEHLTANVVGVRGFSYRRDLFFKLKQELERWALIISGTQLSVWAVTGPTGELPNLAELRGSPNQWMSTNSS